jgi:hypothetical protein
MIKVHIRDKGITYTDRLTLSVPSFADVDAINQMLTNYTNGEYYIAAEEDDKEEDEDDET